MSVLRKGRRISAKRISVTEGPFPLRKPDLFRMFEILQNSKNGLTEDEEV
jgi:hypothetical protein